MSAPTDPSLVLSDTFQDAAQLGAQRTFGMYTKDDKPSRVVVDVADDTAPDGYATLIDEATGRAMELTGLRATKNVLSGSHIMRYRVLSGSTDIVVWCDAAADPKGAKGDTGSTGAAGAAAAISQILQVSLAADGAASDTIAEAHLGVVGAVGTVDPWVSSRGTATANDTTYETTTFTLYRAGSSVKTWTITTKTSGGSGGTGNWTNGAYFAKGDPFACQVGDVLTYAQAKASTGVQLPARSYGAKVV